jgi:hypothetical protein
MTYRTLRAPSLALAVLLVLPGAVGAAIKSVQDRRGDSRRGFPDIASAEVKTTPLYVTATITAYARFATGEAPCFSLTHRRPAMGDEFVVCGDGKVQDFQHGRTAGRARVTRPADSSVKFVISRATLRHPSLIGWAIQVRGGSADVCIRRFRDICDQAPGGPGARIYQR